MVKDQKYNPPKWADRLLEWYCAPHQLEDVQGALYEYFYERIERGEYRKARRMFWLDVVGHFRPHIIKRNNSRYPSNNIIMIRNYIKISVRSLWKYKLTSILNILGLTIGITCFMLIMIWVGNEKSFDTFHSRADQIYRISNTFKSESEQFSQAPSGPALGSQLSKIFPQVVNGVRVGNNSGQIQLGDDNYFEGNMKIVDPSFFDVFDFEVISGDPTQLFRDINSIVLTQSAAVKYFGREDPIGKLLTMDGEFPMKVTGLMADAPANSQIQFDMLISMEFLKVNWNNANLDENWGGGWFHTYLELEEGVDPKALGEEITEFIKTKLTYFTERNMSYTYFLQPITSIHLESSLRYDFASNGSAKNVSIFTSVAFIVLLLACINYVNLTTANAVKRSKEIGLKKVMGALRIQLIIQYLVESIMVVFIAASLAVGLVYSTLPGFEDFVGYQIPFSFDGTMLAVLAAGILGLGTVAGLFPAATISAFKPLEVIRGRLTKGIKGTLIRKGLVIFQFTASVALIVAIITVNRQMDFIQARDLGMTTSEVVAVNFRGIQSVRDNHQILSDRLLENPNIKAVSFLRRAYPVDGLSNGTTMVETGNGDRVSSSLYHMWVDEDYARAFGLEMAAGRFFSDQFPTDSTNSILVNEAAVRSFGWGSAEDAIGREMGSGPNPRKVIGVVRDFNFEGLHKKVDPVRILPETGQRFGSLAIRANLSNPTEVLDFIEQTWAEINPTVPLDYTFMDADIQAQYESEFSFRSLFMFFSTLSVVIASLGLFGLATASTNQRIKEIGIRKVLGASTGKLIQLISADFLKLVLISVLLAAPIAWYGMDQWLSGFAYRINVEWTFIVLAGLIALLISLATVSYKAISAAVSNPTKSLRQE